MGAALEFFPHSPHLTDAERCALTHAALLDGTVRRLLDVLDWTPDQLADRVNVTETTMRSWLSGTPLPPPVQTLKLWSAITHICTRPADETAP